MTDPEKFDEDLHDAEPLTFTVSAEDDGTRLDQFVARKSVATRSAAAKLAEDGNVTVGGNVRNKNYRLRAGETVEVVIPPPDDAEAVPQDIPLDIVYEDDDLIVVNKPSGMVVHPAVGNSDGTLVNALLYHCKGSLSGVGGVIRPGIVHRIDRETSGLLVVAKNDSAHAGLAEQLKGHHIDRIYTAVVIGNLKEDSGTVDAPIGRHPTNRKKMAVIRDPAKHARDAVTHWSVLGRGCADTNNLTLVRCQLETGRTHQIRVHMASIGHPILGDPVYGGDGTSFEAHHRLWIDGQCLHAGELTFTHPRTGEKMRFTCPLPDGMKKIVEYVFPEE